MKLFKGNRTRIFGTALAVLGIFETYAREIIPAEYQGWFLAFVGVAIIILRQITTTPPGEKF